MQIINGSIEDINAIFKLYDEAISFQKTKFNKHWQGFERSLVETVKIGSGKLLLMSKLPVFLQLHLMMN